jgi:hypothetical protein
MMNIFSIILTLALVSCASDSGSQSNEVAINDLAINSELPDLLDTKKRKLDLTDTGKDSLLSRIKVEKIAPPAIKKAPLLGLENPKPKSVDTLPIVKVVPVVVVKTAEELNLPEEPVTAPPPIGPSAVSYANLLKDFVSVSGKVNYKNLKSDPTLLKDAISYFQTTPPKASWSKNEKLAYWINAYNLFTLKIVVDNYPIKSIKEIGGSQSTWDISFIEIAGKTYSLNDIENGIIRVQFDEPRIHFAVNCASISCPKLLNRPFLASTLNVQLEAQTKSFINSSAYNEISENSAQISNIFNWYGEDFTKNGRTVISFLNQYSTTKLNDDAKITNKGYSWNLNE